MGRNTNLQNRFNTHDVSRTKIKPNSSSKPKSKPKPNSNSKPKSKPKSKSTSKPNSNSKPNSKLEPNSKSKPKSKPKSKSKSKPNPKSETIRLTLVSTVLCQLSHGWGLGWARVTASDRQGKNLIGKQQKQLYSKNYKNKSRCYPTRKEAESVLPN
jgi:outer membrane biosynthesis protein TonB